MNVKMLHYLVELANSRVSVIDAEMFFSLFPKSTANLRDLSYLHKLGYISILYADDDISEIGVSQKAINYFKQE